MSWVDHVHHTGVSRCFWYLGWRKTSALPYLFLYIVQYCIKHTHTHTRPFLDDVWVSHCRKSSHGQATFHGWWINFPMVQSQMHDKLARTTWFRRFQVQFQKHSKTFKNHIQETCAKYEPWNAKALNWHCPLYEKAYRIPSIHIPCHIPSRIPAHVQCLGTANSCRLLLWALRPVLRQCTAPAYRHHPGSHRISSARTSPGFLINLSAMRYPTT